MTHLTGFRKPTLREVRDHQAKVVFTREDERGREYTIYAAKSHESWEQWGAEADVLSDNVKTVEAWRNGTLAAL